MVHRQHGRPLHTQTERRPYPLQHVFANWLCLLKIERPIIEVRIYQHFAGFRANLELSGIEKPVNVRAKQHSIFWFRETSLVIINYVSCFQRCFAGLSCHSTTPVHFQEFVSKWSLLLSSCLLRGLALFPFGTGDSF